MHPRFQISKFVAQPEFSFGYRIISMPNFLAFCCCFLLLSCSKLPVDENQDQLVRRVTTVINEKYEQIEASFADQKFRVALVTVDSELNFDLFQANSIHNASIAATDRYGEQIDDHSCVLYYHPNLPNRPRFVNCERLRQTALSRENISKIFDRLSSLDTRFSMFRDNVSEEFDSLKSLLNEFERALRVTLETAVINNAEISDVYARIEEISRETNALVDSTKSTNQKLSTSIADLETNIRNLIKRIDAALPNYL